MKKKYWFIDGSTAEENISDVVYTLGYYGSNYVTEVDRWFTCAYYNGVTWLEANSKVQADRFEIARNMLGKDVVNILRDLKSLTLEELWNICGVTFNTINGIVSSSLYMRFNSKEVELIEDLGFYCGEILRSIEHAMKLCEYRAYNIDEYGNIKDKVLMSESEIVEQLSDALGCVFEEE